MLNLIIWAINCRPLSHLWGTLGGQGESSGATELMENSWQIFVIPRVLKQASEAQRTLCVRNKDITQISLPCLPWFQLFIDLVYAAPTLQTDIFSDILRLPGTLAPFNDLICPTKTIQKHNKRDLKVATVFINSAFFFHGHPFVTFFFFSNLVKWKAAKSEGEKKIKPSRKSATWI